MSVLDDAVPGKQPSYYRWYAVGMLALVYTSSQVDRQIMGILLEPIKQDLGATDTQMGFLIGLTFALFYATLGIPIAMIADRSNRRNIIALAISIWSVMTVLCGFVTSFVQMALARIGVAIGEAGSTPPSHSIISDLFQPHERATAMGLFVVGANVGILIAYLGGGWMADNLGWRMAFVVVGVPGLLIALLLMFTVKEPERSSAGSSESDNKKNAATLRETFAFIFKNRTLRQIMIGKALGAFVGYGMVLWVPAFLARSHGLSSTEIGLTLALMIGIGGGIGTLLSGRIVDYLSKFDPRWRVWSIALSKVLLLPFMLTFLMLDHLPLALAFYVLPTMFGAFYLAPTSALIQQLVKVRMRAVAAAISLFLANLIGLGFGPQTVGILSDLLKPQFGADSLRWTLAIFLVINIWCAAHYWLAGRTIRKEISY